ncbi:hypothetical protein COCON_G00180280 [Conger conger]|uniref:Uncharacterized protein n=1 Tax=Conger conger TaxID=82655 RepID=A0A9Q1HT81_CONCO|nr:hypothetical protein COCON_G00180280 [Conger conger]
MLSHRSFASLHVQNAVWGSEFLCMKQPVRNYASWSGGAVTTWTNPQRPCLCPRLAGPVRPPEAHLLRAHTSGRPSLHHRQMSSSGPAAVN